ncbi:hypothetical protein Mgra_00006119 [Meloidogyne graminicola]|uniref:Uncharacterized protein n=1 Tax=Meloidogyne graminicola TaxID=189291 RepID=A0A8S9ZM49_9BILA|nr:hypothetical protein Mgra_00006119 [Meloidogyne graminicola]
MHNKLFSVFFKRSKGNPSKSPVQLKKKFFAKLLK